VFQQALTMYRFHRTPFEKIIDNILRVMEFHDASFTFPTVASTGSQKPGLLKKIIDQNCEIAVHGYQHVKYSLISIDEQENDLTRALRTYKRLGIPIKGFRAPYNSYGAKTPELIEKYGFKWDAGIGYLEENRQKTAFFKLIQHSRELNFVCIPLNRLSDDLMIDELHYSPDEMVKRLCHAMDIAKESQGVIMFDLHPIRIGQPEYVGVLDRIVSYGKKIGGCFPTVSQAIELWGSRGNWNGHEFCCLLTGDVDNFYFRDYLRRLG
jgi:peptidoglycan/xylan/chitin deacetylase (PgdA/CDA1 family)